ncbi:MAG: hypothetical protein HKN13_01960 [Rhodothermales bacterium]|nr:hypothetical protein [Rhodothermales bacterium]
MKTNALPPYDASDTPTGCCSRFNPEGWDGQELHFEDKLFLKAQTRSIFHIPVNMGSVFSRTFADIEDSGARSDDDFIVMSRDPSNWKSEHYFSVTRDVPEHEMVHLSGDFITKVFEGPYRNIGRWEKEMESYVMSRGHQINKSYYFYTTCPKCAKVYGKNYVVAVAEIESASVAV